MEIKKFTAPMTLEERGAMEKFKDKLENEEDCDYDCDVHSDNLLIRFLRARQCDVNKAYFMFTEYLKFREKMQLETILTVSV